MTMGYAQHTFTTVAGPIVVNNGSPETVNINDMANAAGVPSGVYAEITVTVDWSNGDDAWSSEADLTVVTAGGSVEIDPPTSGAANSGDATTMTFNAALPGDYDPDVDGDLSIVLNQSWSGSFANWANIIVTISPAPEAPNCASEPIFPANNAVDVEVGNELSVTWTAPASGPTPTGYDFYVGLESDGSDLAYVATLSDTSIDLTFNFFSTSYYWQVVPLNGISSADNCDIWSFTTETFAGDQPATLETVTMNVCNSMMDSSNPYDASVSGIHWIRFEYSGGCETIEINTNSTTGFTDTELVVYDSNGNAILTDDDGGEGLLSLISTDELMAGTYFIAAGAYNVAFGPGFDVTTDEDSDTGTLVVSFSSGNALSLNEQSIEGFKFFPNPSNDMIYLESLSEIDRVILHNMLGQEVLMMEPGDMSTGIDISSLNSGSYFMTVESNNQKQTVRIIKN